MIDNSENTEANSIVPSMSGTAIEKSAEGNLIGDEQLLGVYDEIMKTIRTDREEIDQILGNFINMVVNDGDSTTSSKEALVNLLKLKAEQADKMSKIADLMTRVKMKDKDTFPKYLANSNNVVQINSGGRVKRAILEAIAKNKKEEKND